MRLIASSSCSGMKRTGLQPCLSGKSPLKDSEKKAKISWVTSGKKQSELARRQLKQKLWQKAAWKGNGEWFVSSKVTQTPLFLSAGIRLSFSPSSLCIVIPTSSSSDTYAWNVLGLCFSTGPILPAHRGVALCHRAISRRCLLQHRERSCWHRRSTCAEIGLVTLNTLDNKSSLWDIPRGKTGGKK